MLFEDRVSVDRGADRVDQRRLQHVERPAREGAQQLVARGGRDHAVEARVGEPERLRGRVVPLGLGDRGEQLLARSPPSRAAPPARRAAPRGRCAPRPARRARRRRVSSITAIDSLTLRRMPSLCVLSTKMPPPGPLRGADQVRAREQPQPLAQGRPADAELGRELLLGAEALARAAGRARRGSGGSRTRPARSHPCAATGSASLTARTSRRGRRRPRAAAARSRPARPGSTSSSTVSSSSCSLHACAPGTRTPARGRPRRPRSPATERVPPACSARRSMIA